MPAYVLVEVDIYDPEEYEKYKSLTPATVAAYGGKFLIRGNPVQVLEGSWVHDRLVLIEFPDNATAEEWYFSKEYQNARSFRIKASNANLFLV
jgi:uncharacterized protein (DUF1330 family)